MGLAFDRLRLSGSGLITIECEPAHIPNPAQAELVEARPEPSRRARELTGNICA